MGFEKKIKEEEYFGCDYRQSMLLIFRDCPPAIIVVAGHDPLHDDGVAYAEKLKEVGVSQALKEYRLCPTGF